MIKPIYGLMAEFDNPTSLVNAARLAREQGYRKLDAYSPFPIEELSDTWGTDPTVRGSTVWFEMLIPGSQAA